jgi:type I restriction enzyme R subunit
VLKKRFDALMQLGSSKYLTLAQGKRGDKAVEAILEHFRDKEPREEFYAYFRELEELHEIISPDAFMRPFIEDFGELAAMYQLVKASYDRGTLVDKSFLRKTATLVRQHTSTSEIQSPTTLQKLDSDMLEAIAAQDQPDTVKVFNLLKAIDQLTRDNADREPYIISIGDKAEQIATAFEERQQTTQSTLDELQKLIAELNQARRERDATELSPESFAVYWLLKRDGVENANEVAQAASRAFEANPHWQTSSHQEQEVRKGFYKALIDAGVEGVVDVAQQILKTLRRAGP